MRGFVFVSFWVFLTKVFDGSVRGGRRFGGYSIFSLESVWLGAVLRVLSNGIFGNFGDGCRFWKGCSVIGWRVSGRNFVYRYKEVRARLDFRCTDVAFVLNGYFIGYK